MVWDFFVFCLILSVVIIVITFYNGPHTKTKPLLNKNVSKSNFVLITLFSIILHTVLFIATFYLAAQYDKLEKVYFGGNPFNWENTWSFWWAFLLLVFLIEKVHFTRKRSTQLKKPIFKVLYYLSFFSTITSSIAYFLVIDIFIYKPDMLVQEGFDLDIVLLQSFFYFFAFPVFFWIVYYFVKKYYDELISYVYKKQQKRNQKKFKRSKFLKKQQAITEIKEAKELVDLGILSKEEYDELSKKLKPIILENEP